MGLECILSTYAVGLVSLIYGLYILVAGRVHLTPWSRGPLRGITARMWGFFCVILAAVWFLVLTWAWGKYGRV
jgi:hypothetical protein